MLRKSEKRLTNEFKYLQNNPLPNIKILLIKDNIYKWLIELIGPNNSPYKGGIFYFVLDFPTNYPFKPSDTPLFISKVIHPCIHYDGYLCPCTYDEVTNSWSPTHKVADIIEKIYNLFVNVNFYNDCHRSFNISNCGYEGKNEELNNKCIERVKDSIIKEDFKNYSFNGKKYSGELKKYLGDFFKENVEIHYTILNEIGYGAIGRVFKAINYYGIPNAIKIINKNKIKESLNDIYINDQNKIEKEYIKYIENLHNESSIMRECSFCNNSIYYFDCYENENEFAIVMELCDENLLSLIKRKKEFKKEEIYDILIQLNNIFKIMKEKNIIHRDLKPENILIKYHNEEKTMYNIKLSDYSSSKKLTNLKEKCKTINGSMLTMAPEVLNGEEYNYKCDLWSLGIIIYLLVFGQYPYNGDTEIATLRQIEKFDKYGQKKILKHTEDKLLDNLIFSLLVKDPENRLSWKEYFNHPFFIQNKEEKEKKNHELIMDFINKK